MTIAEDCNATLFNEVVKKIASGEELPKNLENRDNVTCYESKLKWKKMERKIRFWSEKVLLRTTGK